MTAEPDAVTALPSDAAHIVIGAGAVGCSVAAALVESGRTDVVVLDANADVAQGTTSMGAGMFGLLRGDLDRVVGDVDGLALLRDLERTAEVKPGWEQTGSIRLACSDAGVDGLHALLDIARRAGVTAELVGPADVGAAWGMLDVSRIKLGLYVPEDGQIRPHQVAAAFRHQAVRGGALFVQDTVVSGILTGPDGRVRGVQTDRGAVSGPCVIDAAGASAAGIARTAGLELPIVPVRHSYFVTAPLATIPRPLPHLRLTEEGLYARTRDGGILVGGWETPGSGLALDPRDMRAGEVLGFPALPWEAYDAFGDLITDHMPGVVRWPRQAFAAGWPTFTPDGRHVIGESTRTPGLVMAAGCNAHGIAGAPAIGRLVVESLDPSRTPYLESLSPDRFLRGFAWDDAIAGARRQSETYNTLAAQAV
jgi:glycine/D-amino acid oxidase-like deaminating enzyme